MAVPLTRSLGCSGHRGDFAVDDSGSSVHCPSERHLPHSRRSLNIWKWPQCADSPGYARLRGGFGRRLISDVFQLRLKFRFWKKIDLKLIVKYMNTLNIYNLF